MARRGLRSGWLALAVAALTAIVGGAEERSAADILRPLAGDLPALLSEIEWWPRGSQAVHPQVAEWLRDQPETAGPAVQVARARLLHPGDEAALPADPVLAAIVRGWWVVDHRDQLWDEDRYDEAQELSEEGAARAREALAAAAEHGRHGTEARLLALDLVPYSGGDEVRVPVEQRAWAREVLADATASPAAWASAIESLQSTRWYPGAGVPDRAEVLGALRKALARDGPWSENLLHRARVNLAEHLLEDSFARRAAPARDVAEGRALLREHLEHSPGDTRARGLLVQSLMPEAMEEARHLLAAVEAAGMTYQQRRWRTIRDHLEGRRHMHQEGGAVVLRLQPTASWTEPVWVTGDFDEWTGTTHRAGREGEEFVAHLRPPPGRYRYRLVALGRQAQDDPVGALAVCDGSPCFEVGEDGELVPEDPEDLDLRRARAYALAGRGGHALAREEAFAVLQARPRHIEELELLISVYQSGGRDGDLLADFDAHKGLPSWTEEGRAYLVARRETGDRDLVSQEGLVPAAEDADPSGDQDSEATAEEVLARELAAGEGAAAYVKRLWSERRWDPDEGSVQLSQAYEAVLLRGLEAYPTSRILLEAAMDRVQNWEDTEGLAAALALPEGEEERSALRGLVRGKLLRRLDDLDGAERALHAAAMVAPGWGYPRHELGCVLVQAGRLEPAARWLEAAYDQGETSVHVRVKLVYAGANSGRYAQVVALAEEGGLLDDLSPEDPWTAYLQAMVAQARIWGGGDLARARDELRVSLPGLTDEVDPRGEMGRQIPWALVTHAMQRRQPRVALDGIHLFQDALPIPLWPVLLGLAAFVGVSCIFSLLFLRLVLRSYPALRSFLVVPPLLILVWTLELVGATLASWWLYEEPLLWIADQSGAIGTQLQMISGVVWAPVVCLFVALELRASLVEVSDLDIGRRPTSGDLAAGTAAYLGLLVTSITVHAGFAYLYLSYMGTAPGANTPNIPSAAADLRGAGFAGMGVFLLVVFLAPLAEEALFRGYFYGTWRKKLGPRPANFLSSLLFAAIHLGGHVHVFLAGIFFAWVYERRGTLWAPVVAHIANNAVAMTFLNLGLR